jgi:limonene-1,2-epoxide hydrolase
MTDTSTDAIEIVRRFLKAMEPLDYVTALALVSPTCVYINPPPIGEVSGPEGIRAVLEPFFSPTLENEFKVLRESATDGIEFMERLDRHRLKDKWVELPVTGVFEVKDGLITYWRDYFDAATILAQWTTG